MPNSAAVKAFFATRLKQPRLAAQYKRNGRVSVIVRVTSGHITFPTSYDGANCVLISAKRPLPGRLTVVQLLLRGKAGICVKHFGQHDTFAAIEKKRYLGRTVAIDFAGDVRLAGKQVFV